MITFLRRWGWLILFIVAAILLFIITAGRTRLDIGKEIAVAKADAKAEKLAAKLGHVEAVKRIEEEHKEAIAQLEEKQKAEAVTLKNDPAALSRFLARAASGKKKT